MIDSSLKELLQSLKKVNEMSQDAINKLTSFIENETTTSDENLGKLTTSIFSLNDQIVEVKKLHQKLTDKSSSSKDPAPIDVVQSNHEDVSEKPKKDSEENVISNLSNETVDDTQKKLLTDESSSSKDPAPIDVASNLEEVSEKPTKDSEENVIGNLSNNSIEAVDDTQKLLTDESSSSKDPTPNDVVPSNHEDVSEKPRKDSEENVIDNSNETVDDTQKGSDDELDENSGSCIIKDDSIKAEVVDKPFLKIVDFNKLVDPRNLELMDNNEKRKETSGNMSIIVLSSSDDEPIVQNKLNKTVGHTNKSSKTSKKNIHVAKPDVALASTSYSKQSRSKSTKQELQPIQIGNLTIESSHPAYMTIKKDQRIKCKPYVKLLRVPCEEMKTFYANNAIPNESGKGSERKTSAVPSEGSDSQKNPQSLDELDSDQKGKKKRLKNKSKFKNTSEKDIIESSDEDTQSCSVKKKSKVFSKKRLKTSSRENCSSEGESQKTLNENESDSKSDEIIKDKKNCNTLDKDKSRYQLSDEDCVEKDKSRYHLSDLSVEDCVEKDHEKESGNSDNRIGGNSSKNKSFSDDSEKEISEDLLKNPSSQEKEEDSDKQIIINSEDSENSDSDSFFKKNKLTRKVKKIKALISDSEDDEEKDKKTDNESEKESTKSDSSSEKEEDESQTRKRKRIRKIEDDSSESDEAVTRKKIKKVISKDSLSVKTKKAETQERERKQRILEKQKKYNQIYESSDLANSKVEKLVLDVDEETGKPLLEVHKSLVSKLKPHQASGIQFMWDACFESIKRIEKSKGSGCILAHCMGLGKTLQVIALTNTLLEEEKTQVRKVLIVTPLSTVLNWKAEYKNWLSGKENYEVYELASVKAQNAERAFYVREWHNEGGVMIMSYSMFRNLSNEKNRKISKKIRETFVEGLVDPGPDLVVCDEGHLLKNEKTGLSIAMNKIKTRRRIVLTGTPLQNNMKEYYCMVQFVKPNLLGTYKEYLNRFVNPITNGQYTDSTQYDINLMRRRSHVLHKLLDGIVQRRDYGVLSPYLPPKFEYVLFLTLSEAQTKLYKHYMEHFGGKSKDEGSTKTSFLFKDFQALSRICIHPRVLLDKSNDDQLKYQSDEESIGSLKDFIDDESSSSTPESSESESDSDSKKKRKRVTKRVTRAQKNNPSAESSSEEEIESKKEWWQEYCDGEELDNIAHSTKLLLLFEILKECEQIGDKVLLFSQSLYALNTIEYFLEKVDEATQNGNTDEKTCGFSGSWSPGLDYFRLDGSTNCSLRSEWCQEFNRESNTRARLFLLSTKAGGLGINLVAANRVILFDVSWNPSSDIQSIYRVYRFGQLKPSYIYRFVVYGTMEMKIYERQVTKQAISKRVIDEQQIDRHYNQNDLAELYKFEEPDLDVRPTPLVPKDVLLGELLINHDDKIYKYHEHQSLLENKEDETLNEEERKAAWDEFENEKVERTKQPLIGKFSVNTVQLALRNIIQRDNPTWNNNQILSIIPQLIQQLNLQLSLGDQTMYNRIAAEIKAMQDEYARKMQLQFYQYRLQLAQNQMQNMFQQPRFPMMNVFNNRMPLPPNFNPSGSNLNPNEIVDLN